MFVTGSLHRGGAERHTVALINGLASRGHRCDAVYVQDRGGTVCDLGLRDRLPVHCLAAKTYLDVRAMNSLAALIRRTKPSVIVAANPYALMYATLARRRARARLLTTYHSTVLPSLKERLQMLAYRPFFWAADCAVFVCSEQRRYWRRRAVFSRRNEVVHNGIDETRFRNTYSDEERSKLRRGLGLSDGDYVIGISAWLRPEKNHMQLVEAVARLREQGFPARALMIGDGELRESIEARARALGVERHVVITGSQRDVRPCVAVCDVVVLCSVAVETFSLAALEAMAMEKPVIHSDLGGAREMVFPGQNGFLFPARDTAALVQRLATLADRDLARRMGRAARAIVEQRFAEETMVGRYETLLLELRPVEPDSAAVPEPDPNRTRGRRGLR